MDKYLLDILSSYNISADSVKECLPYGDGHINTTFKIRADKTYLLQKINHLIFTNPHKLMENMVSVTKFLQNKAERMGKQRDRATLTVIKTVNGENYTVTENGEYFRLMIFIDAISINSADDPQKLRSVGQAFGEFQNMLSDYPSETLFEVIPDFHNTVQRFNALEAAIKEDRSGRVNTVKQEIDYALSMRDRIGVVAEGIENGSIPLRVAHNDTKLNNVLLDKDTFECICVIDLDTVMPGSYLYDYGDALRSAGSSVAEDEKDLSRVYFDLDKFTYFTAGYLPRVAEILMPREIELLPFSVELLTYECGIRFLTDYLNGDTYFKIAYDGHNLDRARAQFALARDIDKKLGIMAHCIEEIIKE